MYLFLCVRVDLALEQTAGLIGWETKVHIYPQQHSLNSRSGCAPSFSTLLMPPEPSRDAEGTLASFSPQEVVISHCDYLSLAHGFFYLALQPEKWQISSHHVSPSYLPPLVWLLNGKLTVCLVSFWVLSTPRKQVQSSARELDVKMQYFPAGHLFF